MSTSFPSNHLGIEECCTQRKSTDISSLKANHKEQSDLLQFFHMFKCPLNSIGWFFSRKPVHSYENTQNKQHTSLLSFCTEIRKHVLIVKVLVKRIDVKSLSDLDIGKARKFSKL